MQFGVAMFPTDYAMDVVELGRAAEERGFESLWVPEHTHIPASRRTPHPSGADLPRDYWHTLDPFVALSAVAAATRTLRLGTGVCLVIERDPIVLAKEVASLDFVSRGRVLFGVGAGWNREEMENHGTDPRVRFGVLRERIAAMKAIWTQEDAEYHGKYVSFDPLWSYPKPLQQPHPPIVVGGNGPGTLKRVVEYGDEWMPMARRAGAGELEERIPELQRLAAEAGRGPIPVGLFFADPEPAALARYQALGIVRSVFYLPSAPAAEILPLLDQFAGLARQFV